MKTTVRREGDRVWLDGVSGWFVGDQESSVHAAQAATMEAVGEHPLLVEGSHNNIKVTLASDIELATCLLCHNDDTSDNL